MLGTMPVQTNGGTHRLGWRNQQLNHAHEQGYLVFQNSERTLAAEWKRVCRSRRKPYLHVRHSRTNAVVFLDMDPAGERLMPDTKVLMEAVCELVAAQDIRCGRSFLYCRQVPTAAAHPLARLILRLVHFQEANAGRHAHVA